MKKISPIFKNFFKNRFRAVLVLVITIFVGYILFRTFGGQKNSTQTQTDKVQRGTIISSISVSGQILTANIVGITTTAKGLVKAVYVQDGDQVFVGQKIVEITLDPDGQQKNASAYSSYLGAKNSLDSAQVSLYTLQSDMLTKWKTYKDLAENSTYQNSDATPRSDNRTLPQFITPQNDWLAAEAKYKNQQNVITQAQASLSSAWFSYQSSSPIIAAPLAGTITNLTFSPGMTLSPATDSNQRVAVIKSEGLPLASFNLSEIDVSQVKPGQKATIKLDSLADKTFTGKVLTVDRLGSVSSGVTNYPIVIQLDTEAAEILPNMAATANIILESKNNVLLIPSSAIQKQDNQNSVRVLKNKQEQTVTVETGLTSDAQTEILSGLSEGDEVIISSTTNGQSATGSRSVFSSFGGGASRMMIGR